MDLVLWLFSYYDLIFWMTGLAGPIDLDFFRCLFY